MAFDITELIKEQLHDSIADQLGGLLGENHQTTQSAIGGAVPAILSGLVGSTGDKKGVESLFNAVKDHDDGFLDSLGDIIGGTKSTSVIESGTKLLSNLLGDNGLGSIVGALSAFTGMGRKSSNSLVSVLAPIVIGVIKRKVFSGDKGGSMAALSSLFAGQKDNINNAMPSGMKAQLDTSGFFDRLDAAVEERSEFAEQMQETAREATSGGSSMMRKFIPILIVAGVAWFAFNTFKAKEAPIQPAPQINTSTIESSIEPIDYSAEIGSIFGETTNTFSQITDIDSANEQLSNLKNIVLGVEEFSGTFVGLPDETRAPVIVLAKDAFSELQPVIDGVLEAPGVNEIIKPTSDALMEQLNQLIQ